MAQAVGVAALGRTHPTRPNHYERFLPWGPPPSGTQKAVPEPIRRVSELDITYPRGALITTTIAPGRETITVEAKGSANLDTLWTGGT